MARVYTQEFEFTLSDLTRGTDYLSVRAQQELKAHGLVSGPQTGAVRVQLRADNSARCEVILYCQSKPVYTVWHETEPLVGFAGLSRVTDVTDGVRWILQALFDGHLLEAIDPEALTEWGYQEVFGRPMSK